MLVTEHSATAVLNSAASPADASRIWKQIAGPVEPFLHAVGHQLAEQIQAFDPEIASYAEYALTNQGKHLRPTLVALTARATGKLNDSHTLVAVIIEMIHLATLVHDDVIDEAGIRRGRPTLAANWGNEISVLLGDCLFAHALKLASSFPTTEICRAVSSATNTVCSGEILQTQRGKNFEMTRGDYFKVLQMKTGELFALSCDLGAYLTGADAGVRTACRQYGMALGTAYQIYDDCVDLFGSEISAGKSLGTDLVKGKLTLPMFILLEKLPVGERPRIQGMVRKWEADFLPQIIKLLRVHRTLEGCCRAVGQYLDQARQALGALPANESRDALQALTEYLARQTEALGRSEA